MNNWINANERKPDKSDWYLAVVRTKWGEHMVVMAYYFGKAGWVVQVEDGESESDPLYWQPLPDLPEGL